MGPLNCFNPLGQNLLLNEEGPRSIGLSERFRTTQVDLDFDRIALGKPTVVFLDRIKIRDGPSHGLDSGRQFRLVSGEMQQLLDLGRLQPLGEFLYRIQERATGAKFFKDSAEIASSGIQRFRGEEALHDALCPTPS